MKKITIILILLLIACLFIQAQEKVVVKPGTNVYDYFKHDEIYKFPEFRDGTVKLKNGDSENVKMNYHILLSEMHFLAPPKDDTLSISKTKSILYIGFDKDTFYYNNGYLEYVSQNSRIKLLQKQYVRVIDVGKASGYGTTSSTGAITNYISYGGTFKTNSFLTMENEMTLIKQIDYYFSLSPNKYLLFSKGNILKAFPNEKDLIKSFLQTNKIDFKKREDITKVFDYLGTLK